MIKSKRLFLSVSLGAMLGIICIIGVGFRLGYKTNELFLIATWFNRLLLGFVIGIAYDLKFIEGSLNVFIRGAFIGLFVGGSLFLATGFRDLTGFLAGIAYGIIIDYIATKYSIIF